MPRRAVDETARRLIEHHRQTGNNRMTEREARRKAAEIARNSDRKGNGNSRNERGGERR